MLDQTKPFQIEYDASKYASGAVLAQLDSNGDQHPVAFLSKTFNKTKQNYEILLQTVLLFPFLFILLSITKRLAHSMLLPPLFHVTSSLFSFITHPHCGDLQIAWTITRCNLVSLTNHIIQ